MPDKDAQAQFEALEDALRAKNTEKSDLEIQIQAAEAPTDKEGMATADFEA